MRVVVSRSGGIAGMRLVWDVRIDDQPDASAWRELLAALPWDDTPPAVPEPDRYVYRIRCPPHDVVLAEPQLRGPWQELVDKVRAASRDSAT